MPSLLATHFENLRQRFPVPSEKWITDSQHSFETMESIAGMHRPAQARCAFLELAGINFLIWEMDKAGDEFRIFATPYAIDVGSIRLSSKPSGTLVIAGFYIDLAALSASIAQLFGSTKNAENQAPPNDQKKRKILLFGWINSFGHHFWNEVNGLTSAIATGLFDKLDGVIVGPFDYFNLGPWIEAQGKTVWKLNQSGTIILPDQLLMYCCNVVTAETRQFIINNAAAQEPTKVSPNANPSICFQIRRHRRPWCNEENGLVHLISTFAKEWPGMSFYIDGHGTSKGNGFVMRNEIAHETSFFNLIKNRIDPIINLQSTIGMEVNSKITLLKDVTVFATSSGSGSVLPSWIIRRPTVLYGPKSSYDMVRYHEEIAPEGGSVVRFIDPKYITDINDAHSSFDVDVESICSALRKEICENYPTN